MKKLVASIVTFAVLGSCASTAVASTGSFSHSGASADWKTANFGVSGSSSVCGLGGCSWFPVVIATPSLPQYRCGFGGEEAFDSDPNTQIVWTGTPARTADAAFAAEVSNAAILSGVYGQHLCLALIGSHLVKDFVCEAQAPIFEEFGSGPISCPPVSRTFEENLTSVLLAVEAPPPAAPAAAPVTTPPAPTAAPAKRFSCSKPKKKVRRAGKWKCAAPHSARKHGQGKRSAASSLS